MNNDINGHDYRLILAFDFDGTVVNDNGEVHPEDIEILKTRKDICFIPATGRPLYSVRELFNKYQLFVEEKIDFPMVLQNGTILYLPGEELLSYFCFEPGLQRQLVSIFTSLEDVSSFFAGLGVYYYHQPTLDGDRAIRHFDLEVLPFSKDAEKQSFSKLMSHSNNPEKLRKVKEVVSHLPVEQAFTHPTFFEIMPLGATKGHGLQLLIEKLGLTGLPILTAGDADNDISLLRTGTMSFAPVKAEEAVRNEAKYEIDISKGSIFKQMLSKISL